MERFRIVNVKNIYFLLYSCLARGIVEKLEVVNKKWVRVRLTPGNTIDGAVRYKKLLQFFCCQIDYFLSFNL